VTGDAESKGSVPYHVTVNEIYHVSTSFTLDRNQSAFNFVPSSSVRQIPDSEAVSSPDTSCAHNRWGASSISLNFIGRCFSRNYGNAKKRTCRRSTHQIREVANRERSISLTDCAVRPFTSAFIVPLCQDGCELTFYARFQQALRMQSAAAPFRCSTKHRNLPDSLHTPCRATFFNTTKS
jgi:hypothetical protein